MKRQWALAILLCSPAGLLGTAQAATVLAQCSGTNPYVDTQYLNMIDVRKPCYGGFSISSPQQVTITVSGRGTTSYTGALEAHLTSYNCASAGADFVLVAGSGVPSATSGPLSIGNGTQTCAYSLRVDPAGVGSFRAVVNTVA
ncbi:MAG: hypothetical protein LC750_14975 [Actinobacteria bacterium]|nr:hypothetical protein [Actinomycetota bacterium]